MAGLSIPALSSCKDQPSVFDAECRHQYEENFYSVIVFLNKFEHLANSQSSSKIFDLKIFGTCPFERAWLNISHESFSSADNKLFLIIDRNRQCAKPLTLLLYHSIVTGNQFSQPGTYEISSGEEILYRKTDLLLFELASNLSRSFERASEEFSDLINVGKFSAKITSKSR